MRLPTGTLVALAALALALAGNSLRLSAQTVVSTRENDYTVVTGSLRADGWFDQAREIVFDFGRYREWALRFMDGRDPGSADSWVKFTDFIFEAPTTMTMYYDLNLGWPLSSVNNRADFAMTIDRAGGVITYAAKRPPFGMSDARMVVRVDEEGNTIVFRIEVRFWWILEALLDRQMFQLFVEDRVAKMTRNLYDRAHERL